MKTITIEIPEGKRAKWVDGMLTLIDDTPQDITERIKTFEDAVEWCKDNGKFQLVNEYCSLEYSQINGEYYSSDLVAYLKLRVITCALNEGWEPKQSERRMYLPYLDLCNKRIHVMFSYSLVLSALMLKSEKLAKYAATQFKGIYMDFCYKGKE